MGDLYLLLEDNKYIVLQKVFPFAWFYDNAPEFHPQILGQEKMHKHNLSLHVLLYDNVNICTI